MPGKVTQSDFGRLIGKNRATVSKYETDDDVVPDSVLRIISEVTGKSLRFFQENSDYSKEPSVFAEGAEAELGYSEIPYWGAVPAGDWQEPSSDAGLTMRVENNLAKEGRIAVRVAGESMSPRLEHGDVVIVQKSKTPREGVITLARNDANELTLKVLRHTTDGQWELHPINKEFSPTKSPRWEILGYAVAIQRIDDLGLRP